MNSTAYPEEEGSASVCRAVGKNCTVCRVDKAGRDGKAAVCSHGSWLTFVLF